MDDIPYDRVSVRILLTVIILTTAFLFGAKVGYIFAKDKIKASCNE